MKRLAAEFRIIPGQRINEVELAQRLRISRTPVRSALNRLVRDGFMILRPNRGFFVREIDPEDVRYLYELRSAVESSAIRLACQRARDEDIAAAAEAWRRAGAERVAVDPEKITSADEALHGAIAQMSGNGHMVAALEGIYLLVRFFQLIDNESEQRRQKTFAEHDDILAALATRDAERAASAIERHLSLSAERAVEITRASLVRLQSIAA